MARSLTVFTLVCALAATADAQEIPTPESFLGHRVGADRELAPYPKVLEYLRAVADASERVSIESQGPSTLGNEMVAVVLTSEENQTRLERYREIAARLANPDDLGDEEAKELVAEGKVIALVTCTIHSTEVGCTQMAMEFVHDYATTRDPDKVSWMNDAILLVMPSINPDGQILVVDWYDKTIGSEYEGGRMPWLYHHYVGHDNNRDFYMLTQKETRAVNELLYKRWFPQIFVDEHQMGSTRVRMFVPPQADPLAPEVHSLIFRQADLLGTNMSYRLEEAGKTGVGHNMIYDSYWPGGTRNTAWWKNVTGLLTEVASARIATPIYIEPGELQGNAKGFPEYKRRANFPSPWPGGWWRLRDIVEYELIATWALAESVSKYRREILRNFRRMGHEAIAAGESAPPYGWILLPEQHDPVAAGKLVELLLAHGVRVFAADEPFKVGRTSYPAGTHIIPAAQPYRAFLLTMLREQRYPEVRAHSDGPIIPPYDVTAWSLPLLMGVDLEESVTPIAAPMTAISEPLWPGGTVSPSDGGYLISHAADSAPIAVNRFLAAGKRVFWLATAVADGAVGDIYLPADEHAADELSSLSEELHLPIRGLEAEPAGKRWRLSPQRVGLFKPWVASMDEGWTRFLLERYEFPHRNLANEDLRDGSFRDKVDVVLFPDVAKSILEKGEPEAPEARRLFSRLPPEYAGGIGSQGGDHLKKWVEAGGTVVALDSSTAYLIDLFGLPVRDAMAANGANGVGGVGGGAGVEAPGTLLRLLIDNQHPLGFGMRSEEAGYFARSPAFRTYVPDARFERRVVARYPDHRDDIRISGYLAGAEHLERLAAVVEYGVGEGRVVLIGFRAQHRAQPHRTFKLLFNALQISGLTEKG